MNAFLRLFNVETLIVFVTDLLARTIKNPNSAKALQLRGVVRLLYQAAKQFLLHTGGIPEDF